MDGGNAVRQTTFKLYAPIQENAHIAFTRGDLNLRELLTLVQNLTNLICFDESFEEIVRSFRDSSTQCIYVQLHF